MAAGKDAFDRKPGRTRGPVHYLVNSTDTFKELTLLYVLCLVGAAGVFALAEDKTFGDSLWWSVVTAMTVGYGDFAPATTAGRLAGVALMHLVPLFVIPLIIVRLLKTFVRDENEFTHAEQEAIRADLAAIKKALKIDQ
jgi:voltage-gated potassium channel